MSASVADPETPSGFRKIARRALIAAGALALLYLATAFALSRFLDPIALAEWLEPRMEQAFNRDVEVGAAEVGFLPLGVELKEVTLSDPTGLATHLATVESVDLRVALLPLFRREVQVSRLIVQGPQADLRVGEDGLSNFGDFSAQAPSGPEPGSDRPFVLNLSRIRVDGGELRYSKSGEDPLSAGFADLAMTASGRKGPGGGWEFTGSTEGELAFQKGSDADRQRSTPFVLDFEVAADGDLSTLQVREGKLHLGAVTFDLNGAIAALKEPVRVVDLTLEAADLSIPDLMTMLPDSIRARIPGEVGGALAFDLRIQGDVGPGRIPTVEGTAVLSDGQMARDGTTLADGILAEFDILADRSVQTRARGRVLDGPFSIEGSASTGMGLNLDVDATPDLAALERILDFPEGVTAQGQLVADLGVSGPIGSLQDLRFVGAVTASQVVATHPGLGVPLAIENGEMRLDGRRATLSDLSFELGEDRLWLSGEFPDFPAFMDPETTPRFSGSVRGARLDLREVSARPPPDSTLTYGKVAFAKIGDRSVAGRTFQDAARDLGLTRPASIPLAGSLSLAIDTILDRKGRMESVDALLDFGPSFMTVSEVRFNRFGGEITAAANLSFSPEDQATPFSFRLQVRELDAGGFLSHATPLGQFARGTISVDLELIGTLDGLLLPDRPGLLGSGSFSLTGGGLSAAPLTDGIAGFLELENLREPSIRDWRTSFVMEDGRVRLADATVEGAPGSPSVGGSVGLDGGLDLQSIFNLPSERLNSTALDRLGVVGEIAANLAQRPEVVQAVLRIGGSVFNPAIQADPRATAATLGAAVREEVTREAQEQVDAQRAEAERILRQQQAEAQRRIDERREQLRNRATGFLRNLVQSPDTAGTDTLPADTVPPDTLRPDTIRPDTLRPDTLRPDTIRPDTLRLAGARLVPRIR